MNIERIKELFQQSKGMKIQIEKNLQVSKTEKYLFEKKLKLIEEAQVFLQKVAKETQEQLKIKVEDIVNLALETCFPGEYNFEILFEISRGKTEAELIFKDQKTNHPIDPMEASGGGVADVVAFALRIACYALEQGTDNCIILDEPMKFVSRDLLNNVSEILKTLSDKLKLQIIMVTHIPEFIDVADRVFTVKKNEKGISEIKVS